MQLPQTKCYYPNPKTSYAALCTVCPLGRAPGRPLINFCAGNCRSPLYGQYPVPLFGWSDTWQLVINTGTTIVTFLMVFVIQNTQSRDTQAMQLKLDELIRVNKIARNSLIDLEEMSDTDVERMKAAFAALASREREERQARASAP